ncbi:hypothetical protein RJ640_019146 [Escallonia rubra]|uniref:Galactose oxidase n=1 Tax=Escallonia rubra TaxID=112253 RepID=A0AA88RME9_9ASTE|nr:hypothetical protein RJ640_019146 [Escallonia rubra]
MACMSITMHVLLLILVAALSSFFNSASAIQPSLGKWKLLKKSIGISAMHMALLPNDHIVTFDRTNFGPSNLTFPKGKCPLNADGCYVHSVEFDPASRSIRPLTVLTDTWCSSGALSSDGVLIQTGGNNNGERVVRYFKTCAGCDWEEDRNGLVSPRWYASNQVLPNGKIIIVGGRGQFSYEFIPKTTESDHKQYELSFLLETRDSDAIPNNLYPFLHLSPDGNLFIFAKDRAILLDYVNNKVVRKYPVMPGGVSRNYPSTGSSVLLPLTMSSKKPTPDAEVFVCGGTLSNSIEKALAGEFIAASQTCGRLVINAAEPQWVMEEMPIARLMGDMILLPTGDVIIINGANKGAAGWGVARAPVLNPVLYRYNGAKGNRFEVLNPTATPRLYHSTAHLLSDGRVLVGGSNPNSNYNFTALFPTELSLEVFYPPYLTGTTLRPSITRVDPGGEISYKEKLSILFRLKSKYGVQFDKVQVTMVSPSFTTHSFAMNQRVLVLEVEGTRRTSAGDYVVRASAPATVALAPPGHYQLFVINDGVPSRATWVHIK